MTLHLRAPGLLALAASVALLSCGQKEADPGISDPGISVSPAALDFTYQVQTNPPPDQAISISVTSVEAVSLGVSASPSLPPWLRLTGLTGSGRSYTLSVGITAAAMQLAPGAYATTLRIGVARADQSIIGTRDVPVQYIVTNTFSVLSDPAFSFQVMRGAKSWDGWFSVAGLGYSWKGTASQPWLKLDATSGVSPGTTYFHADSSGMAEGSYDGTVTVEEVPSHKSLVLPVHMDVIPAGVVCTPSPAILSGKVGQTLPSVDLALALTSGEAGTFTAAPRSGAMLATPSGSLPGTLTVSGNPAYQPPNPLSELTEIDVCSTGGTYIVCTFCYIQVEVTP
jgi:hypothetical protein